MKYKILIFDLDDTLIDNRESVKAAFRRLLEHESATYTEEAFERWYQIGKQFWVDWQDGIRAVLTYPSNNTRLKTCVSNHAG